MKAILFDLGNVLVHYNPLELLTAVADALHINLPHLQQIVETFTHPFGTGQMIPEDLYAHHVKHAAIPTDYATFVYAFCQGIRRNEAALEYTLALHGRAHVRAGIVSNTNALHVAWLRHHVPELWQLDTVVMSNEVGLMKPDPTIYHLALEHLGSTAAATLFIDDIAENVHAAQALGMAGIIHADWAITRPQIEQWLSQ